MRINTNSKFRKYDFRDRCSRQVIIHERVEFFNDIEIVSAPKSEDFSSDVSSFVGDYKSDNKFLNLNFDLKLQKSTTSVEKSHLLVSVKRDIARLLTVVNKKQASK